MLTEISCPDNWIMFFSCNALCHMCTPKALEPENATPSFCLSITSRLPCDWENSTHSTPGNASDLTISLFFIIWPLLLIFPLTKKKIRFSKILNNRKTLFDVYLFDFHFDHTSWCSGKDVNLLILSPWSPPFLNMHLLAALLRHNSQTMHIFKMIKQWFFFISWVVTIITITNLKHFQHLSKKLHLFSLHPFSYLCRLK